MDVPHQLQKKIRDYYDKKYISELLYNSFISFILQRIENNYNYL